MESSISCLLPHNFSPLGLSPTHAMRLKGSAKKSTSINVTGPVRTTDSLSADEAPLDLTCKRFHNSEISPSNSGTGSSSVRFPLIVHASLQVTPVSSECVNSKTFITGATVETPPPPPPTAKYKIKRKSSASLRPFKAYKVTKLPTKETASILDDSLKSVLINSLSVGSFPNGPRSPRSRNLSSSNLSLNSFSYPFSSDDNESNESTSTSSLPSSSRHRRCMLDLSDHVEGWEPPGNPRMKRHPDMTPYEKKDGQYWDRRRKNNEAAKKSRQSRRMKEGDMTLRANQIEQDNHRLRIEIRAVQTEIDTLNFMATNCEVA